MAAYDEVLAQQILLALQDAFPNRPSAPELKSRPPFAEVAQAQWLLALDALFKLELINGKPHRTGSKSVLQSAAYLEITPQGRESLRNGSREEKWKSYYRNFFGQFGMEFYHRWKSKLAAGSVGAIVGFLLHQDLWTNAKNALAGTLLGIAIFAIGDLFRVPWLIHKRTLKQEQAVSHDGFAILGLSVLGMIVASVLYLTAPRWIPTKHRYALSTQDSQYPGFANTLHVFKNLSASTPNKKCLIRLTAPQENREVLAILQQFASDFCDVETSYNPAAPNEEILNGSVNDAIVVHMAKEGSPRELTFMNDMGNVFSVKRRYDLPPGSPDGLIWLQIGRGYPWRKDGGEAGTSN
jgi:hypothetical protein